MERLRSPQKTEKVVSEAGQNITVNSYCVGAFSEFCAVTVDRGKNFLGSRITPLTWVQREKGKA